MTRREIVRRIRRGLERLADQPQAVELFERDWMDGERESFIEAESEYRLQLVAEEIGRIMMVGSKATSSSTLPTSQR